MKYIIIGKQACGKHLILNILQDMGVSVGREFSNLPEKPSNLYMDANYEHYTMDDVNHIFENKSYIYLSGIESNVIPDSYIYYRGLSHYTYDKSDVVVMGPDQLTILNKSLMVEPITFIWLDNQRDVRIRKHVEENRTHSFVDQEAIESRSDSDFVKNLYGFPNSNIIYFNNEVPERVASIIYAMIQHPDIVDVFIKNFN